MDRKDLYQTAYTILNKSTPLRTDCGRLCNQACCDSHPNATEEDTLGMYLFPGEEVILRQVSFLKIEPVRFTLNNRREILLATCQGECERNYRPLACRIFPLTPYLTNKDILITQIDPRAAPICPLANHLDRTQLNQDFIKNVRKVGRLLITEPDIKQFIFAYSRLIIDEYWKLAGLSPQRSRRFFKSGVKNPNSKQNTTLF